VRLIDLSSPIDASFDEPDPIRHEILSPAEGARHMSAEMRTHFGLDLDPSVLPDGEFLSLDTLTLTTHTGTHVDAPSHYGSKAGYGPPRNIDELPLDWFYRPGVVLDLTGVGVGVATDEDLRRAFERIDHVPVADDIVLLHTGASRYAGTRRYFTEFTGLDGGAVELLLDLGVRVIGTDAFSLDAPFGDIIRRYGETGDSDVLWPAHFLGRRREYCQIERLANLDLLPVKDFLLCCFPVRIAGAGAGWARAVAVCQD
jgi:cyclase